MSETQPTYPQQPPPGYYQGPPPKKKHTLRNVLLVIVILLVLIVGGCMALLGSAANEVDKAMKKEEANNRPVEVNLGKGFSHDGYQVAAGWKLARDFGGDATIKGLSVTNTQASDGGGSGRTALLTFRFYKGTNVLAEVECDSKEMQKGESSGMNCVSTDHYPKGYTTIKVADSF